MWLCAGQTRPTRVIRLMVEGTIEAAVLARQQARQQLGDTQLLGNGEADPTSLINLLSSHPEMT